MGFRRERDLERGWSAWRRGEIDEACERLERVLDRAPGLRAAIYPYARALHERGESERALELLSATLGSQANETGAVIHRAWIRFDTGDDDGLAADLTRLGPTNLAAPGIRALAIARRGAWDEAIFPRAALWTADVLGRAVSLLELRRSARIAPADDVYHHRLFAPGASRDAETETTPAPASAKVPDDREKWETELEQAFIARRYARFLELWDAPSVPEEWTQGLSREYWLFAHWAVSPPRVAVRHADELARREPRTVEHHFLHGLALIRAGEPVAASHAFVRTARIDDIRLHEILYELARDEGVTVRTAEE